jgi:hypothetical protein
MFAFVLIAAADAQPTASQTPLATSEFSTSQSPSATVDWYVKDPLGNQSVLPTMSPAAMILLALVISVGIFYVLSLIALIPPPGEDNPH